MALVAGGQIGLTKPATLPLDKLLPLPLQILQVMACDEPELARCP